MALIWPYSVVCWQVDRSWWPAMRTVRLPRLCGPSWTWSARGRCLTLILCMGELVAEGFAQVEHHFFLLDSRILGLLVPSALVHATRPGDLANFVRMCSLFPRETSKEEMLPIPVHEIADFNLEPGLEAWMSLSLHAINYMYCGGERLIAATCRYPASLLECQKKGFDNRW
eukprot:5373561-Amphidinium_carterae.1